MNLWIFLGLCLLALTFGFVIAAIVGPLYCYGCGKLFPENKLSFCEDCIRKGQQHGPE
jgi:rRNA maturation endonuclease Nob1